ncbi:hypothetical protein BDL97_01G056700 [Sphagnum fallax]|nr:hypothetical protein BDL97_01G056700 [Sphagnum fallax]KAH8973600.1 hypothetical protein BDL97_01G056700 [Sphagnum fallax]
MMPNLNRKQVPQVFGFHVEPMSWVMEVAALMAILLANGQGQPPDWEDFLGILFLLIVNSTIRFIEENNVGNAAAALMAHRAPKTKMLQVFRESDVICHSVRRSRVHTSSHIQNLPCHLNNTL